MHRVVLQTGYRFFSVGTSYCCQVVAAHADEGIHLLHQAAVHLCHDFLLLLCCAQKQLRSREFVIILQRELHPPVGLIDNLLYQWQRMHAVAGNSDLFALFSLQEKCTRLYANVLILFIHLNKLLSCRKTAFFFSIVLYNVLRKYAKKLTNIGEKR